MVALCECPPLWGETSDIRHASARLLRVGTHLVTDSVNELGPTAVIPFLTSWVTQSIFPAPSFIDLPDLICSGGAAAKQILGRPWVVGKRGKQRRLQELRFFPMVIFFLTTLRGQGRSATAGDQRFPGVAESWFPPFWTPRPITIGFGEHFNRKYSCEDEQGVQKVCIIPKTPAASRFFR
jgi:hypothetical protein